MKQAVMIIGALLTLGLLGCTQKTPSEPVNPLVEINQVDEPANQPVDQPQEQGGDTVPQDPEVTADQNTSEKKNFFQRLFSPKSIEEPVSVEDMSTTNQDSLPVDDDIVPSDEDSHVEGTTSAKDFDPKAFEDEEVDELMDLLEYMLDAE